MSYPLVSLVDVATINPRPPKDIASNTLVSFIPMAAVSEEGFLLNEEIKEYEEVKKGFTYFSKADVLIAKITPCFENGKSLRPFQIGNDIAFGSTEFHVIRANSEKLCPKYLFYLLWSTYFRVIGEHAMSGAAGQKRVSTDFLKSFKIPLPPLTEQRRIASILDQADELRQKRQQAIEKLDQLLQSTFYDYFGDPIQNTKSFPLKNFKSIIKFTGGSQPPKSVFSDTCKEGYIRLVQIRDFRTDKYLTFIPKDSARRFFKRNDVMIGRYGPPVFQILRGLEGAYNVALMKAEPKAELDNDFLFYLLGAESIQQLVIANSQRSAGQTGVNLEFLNNLVIGVPPLEIQKVWAKIALKIEEQKQNLYNQLDMQNQLFSSLQNQAFNGTL